MSGRQARLVSGGLYLLGAVVAVGILLCPCGRTGDELLGFQLSGAVVVTLCWYLGCRDLCRGMAVRP
jgi:hypothetical protein